MDSLVGDLRAFSAAARKEWRLMRRYPMLLLTWLFWPVVLPLSYVLQGQAYSGGTAAAAHAFAARTGTFDVAGFLFLGWGAYMWISHVLWGPGTALRTEQIRGSLEAVLITPASRLVIVFGPAVIQVLWALWMFGVVGLALWLIFGVPFTAFSILRALVIIVLAVPALYGLGALFASVVLRFGEVSALVQAVRGVFTVCCGMTFPIIILPEWARAVALTLPPTYLIRDLREVLLKGASLAALVPDLVVLLAGGILLCGLAIVAFRRTERYARRGGTLAQY
jgi:ABC-2 type transport system permease protein